MRTTHLLLLAGGLAAGCVSLDHLGDGVRDGGGGGDGASSGGGSALGGGASSSGGGASSGGGSALGGGGSSSGGGSTGLGGGSANGGGGTKNDGGTGVTTGGGAGGGGLPQGGGGGGVVNVGGGGVAGGAGGGGGPPVLCTLNVRGGRMVAANGICIDATEVTNAAYQQFLNATNGDAGGQISDCAWNTDYHPASVCPFDATGQGNYPVTGEDWCDAVAFCTWAGKRLCGGTDGGSVVSFTAADSTHSERTMVCTRNGAQAYPYGNLAIIGACNDGSKGTSNTTDPAGGSPLCDGGYPGVFDLVGNVHEWENVCEGYGGGQSENCWYRGGSYHDLGESCASGYATTRDYYSSACDVGFRCCADP